MAETAGWGRSSLPAPRRGRERVGGAGAAVDVVDLDRKGGCVIRSRGMVRASTHPTGLGAMPLGSRAAPPETLCGQRLGPADPALDGKDRKAQGNHAEDKYDPARRRRTAGPERHSKQPVQMQPSCRAIGSGDLGSQPSRLGEAHLADIGQVPVALGIVDAIADDEFIGDGETHPIGLEVDLASGGFVQQRDGAQLGRVA